MAITFEGSAESANTFASSGLTVGVDIGTRSDGLLVLSLPYMASNTVPDLSVTYGGQSMTQAVRLDGGGSSPSAAIFYLIDPPDGDNDFVLTWTVVGGGQMFYAYLVASWYDGAAQASALDQTNSGTGSTDPSLSITPTEDNELIVSAYMSDAASVLTVGSGETLIEDHDFGADSAGASYAIQTTATAQTVDFSGTDANWAMAVASFKEAAGGGEITGTVNLVSETDAAQSVAWAPMHRLAGQASETELAQALSSRKLLALGQVSETDLAQAMGAVKALLVSQASETGLAQVLTSRKLLGLGQASETDLAQAITAVGEIVVALNQATETDAALGISWAPKNRLVGQATESDVAQAVATLKRLAVGQAGESDLAQAAGVLKALAVGQATETDLAQSIALAGAIIVAVGQATEADVAQAIGRLKVGGVRQASESDLAQAVARLKALGIGQAGETDAAQGVAWAPKHRLVGQAVENDLALAIALVAGVIQIYTASLLANPSPATTAEANVSPQESVAAQPSPAEEVVSG